MAGWLLGADSAFGQEAASPKPAYESSALWNATAAPAPAKREAREAAKIESFGNASTGEITRERAATFLLHRTVPAFREIDLDDDGLISPAELTRFLEFAQQERKRAEVELNNVNRVAVTVAEVREILGGPPKEKVLTDAWRVRQDFEGANPAGRVTPFAKASDAKIGLSLDRTKGSRLWSARGAIFRHFGTKEDDKKDTQSDPKVDPALEGRWGAAVGVTFDVKKAHFSDDPAKKGSSDIDEIAAKASFARDFPDDQGFVRTVVIRGGPVYTTDTAFNSSLAGGEFEIQPRLSFTSLLPSDLALALRKSQLQIRTTQSVRVDAAYVADAGDKPALQGGRWYYRAGPKLSLELIPLWLAPMDLRLLASHHYLAGDGTGPHDLHLMELKLELKVDPLSQSYLSLGYRKGQQPASGATRIDAIEFTTKFKF